MKQISLFSFALVMLLVFSSFKANYPAGKPAHITFETTKHDYGTLIVGANGRYAFKFTNTGEEPLVIQGVQSSCGCTVAKKPDAPIMPGQSDEIVVKYDTRRLGVFHKTITITSNADNPSVVLTIKGEVKPKPQEVAPVKPESEGFTPTSDR